MPEGTTTDGYRLPTTVVPRAYDLSLTPDLDTATFSGTAEVAVDVTEPVERLVLHALDLDIDEAWLERDGERLAVIDTAFDEGLEQVTLTLATPADHRITTVITLESLDRLALQVLEGKVTDGATVTVDADADGAITLAV